MEQPAVSQQVQYVTTTQQVVPQQPPVRAIGAHEVPRECFLTPTASLPQPQTDCDVMCMRKAAAANSVCAATSPASAVRGPAAGPDSVRAATCPASAVGAAGPGSATSTIRASANAAPATDGIRFFRNIGDVSLLITDCFPDHGVFPGARTRSRPHASGVASGVGLDASAVSKP